MFHGTLTVLSRVDASEAALADMRDRLRDIDAQRSRFFGDVPGLHFARWALLPPDSGGGVQLVFGADFTTGDRDRPRLARRFIGRFIDSLVKGDAPLRELFDGVYRHAEGYPRGGLATPGKVKRYLLRRVQNRTTRHMELPYRFDTPDGLHTALGLRQEMDTLLDRLAGSGVLAPDGGRWTRDALVRTHAWLREHFQQPTEPERLLGNARWLADRMAARVAAGWATLAYVPLGVFALTVGNILKWLQPLEDRLRGLSAPARDAAPGEPQLETHSSPVQNPMVLVSEVRPGWARGTSLRLILRVLDVRFRRYLVGVNNVKLIHCMRWLVLGSTRPDSGGRLLFFSNYDGSWDSYIDAFIDHEDVRKFLVLIWSRTRDFPQSDPDRPFVVPFKRWILGSGVPALTWYNAYRDNPRHPPREPSVLDVHNAVQLRMLLSRERIDRPLRDASARRSLESFLTRGTCDPARMPLYVAWAMPFRTLATFLAQRRPLHVLAGKALDVISRGTVVGRRGLAGAWRHPGARPPRLQVHERGVPPLPANRRPGEVPAMAGGDGAAHHHVGAQPGPGREHVSQRGAHPTWARGPGTEGGPGDLPS